MAKVKMEFVVYWKYFNEIELLLKTIQKFLLREEIFNYRIEIEDKSSYVGKVTHHVIEKKSSKEQS